MKKNLLFFLVLATFTIGAHANRVSASDCPNGQYCLLEPLPAIDGVSAPDGCSAGNLLNCLDMNSFVEYVFKFMIAIAVFLAVVMIIYGGFTKMLSETPFKKLAAKDTINNAIFGLIAALSSYLILQTIDPRLVQVNTRIEPICTTENRKAGGICDDKVNLTIQQKFDAEMNAIAAENRLAILANEKVIEGLKEELVALDKRYANKEITQAEYELESAKLKQKISQNQSRSTKELSSASMTKYFSNAVSTINADSYANYNQQQTIDNLKESIKKVHDKNVEAPEIASDPVAKEAIEFETTLRLSELDREVLFKKKIDEYATAQNGQYYKDGNEETAFKVAPEERKEIEKLRDYYQSSYDFLKEEKPLPTTFGSEVKSASGLNGITVASVKDLQKINDNLLLKKDYTRLLEDRITKINQALDRYSSKNKN